MHPGGMEPDNPNLVDYSRLLGFGLSASLYLAIVISQLAVRAIGTNIRLPVIGNLEDPCDSFMCVPALASLLCSRETMCIYSDLLL